MSGVNEPTLVPLKPTEQGPNETITCIDDRKMRHVDAKFYCRKRYAVAFSIFTVMACTTMITTNLSIALIAITSPSNIINDKNETVIKKAQIDWDSKLRGLILSIAFYGHPPACFLSPVFIIKYGGVTVCGLALGIMAILTIVSPFLIKFNLVVYMVARIFEGVALGFVDSSHTEICVRWSPPEERSRFAITFNLGKIFGTLVSHSLSGFLAHHFNWEAIFYVIGGISLTWSIMFLSFLRNYPKTDNLMTKEERNYLIQSTSQISSRKNVSIHRWKAIFSSKPVWALINELFCCGWLSSFVLLCIPLYVKDVNIGNTRDVGLVSSIPIACTFLSELTCPVVADYIRNRNMINHTKLHKIFIAIGQIGVMSSLIAIAMWANFTMSIFLFSLARFFLGFGLTSYNVLPMDMADKYAPLIGGMGLAGLTIAYSLNPLVIGFMVQNHTRSEWNQYFLFLILFNVWGLVIFFIYGSGEKQPWAIEPEEREENDQQEMEKL